VYPTYLYPKIIFSVLRLRETPVGLPSEAMKTMATSTVDRTTSWCPPIQLTPSKHSSPLQESNVSKFDECNIICQSSLNLSSLQEIPTRSPRRDSLEAVVDTLDDGDVDCQPTQMTTLPPTTLVDSAAPPPYKSELAAITAAIERMQQHNDDKSMKPDRLQHPTPDNQSELAAIAAAIEQLEHKWPTPAEPQLRETALMKAPTLTDSLPADDDDQHGERRQSLSLQVTFDLQLQMLRTINMLLVELDDKVDLLLAATCDNPTPNQPPVLSLPSQNPITICKPVLQPHVHPPKIQSPPWTTHHANPSNALAPVSKISPYKKYVPAKPPFPRRRHCTKATIRTKDRMRPP